MNAATGGAKAVVFLRGLARARGTSGSTWPGGTSNPKLSWLIQFSWVSSDKPPLRKTRVAVACNNTDCDASSRVKRSLARVIPV